MSKINFQKSSLKGKDKMKLAEGEYIIFEEGASHFYHFLAIGGTLALTNKRILFTSNSHLNYEHELEITLDRVNRVEFFKTLFLNPNGLAILLKDGGLENFIVDDKRVWCERVQNSLTKAI